MNPAGRIEILTDMINAGILKPGKVLGMLKQPYYPQSRKISNTQKTKTYKKHFDPRNCSVTIKEFHKLVEEYEFEYILPDEEILKLAINQVKKLQYKDSFENLINE